MPIAMRTMIQLLIRKIKVRVEINRFSQLVRHQIKFRSYKWTFMMHEILYHMIDESILIFKLFYFPLLASIFTSPPQSK